MSFKNWTRLGYTIDGYRARHGSFPTIVLADAHMHASVVQALSSIQLRRLNALCPVVACRHLSDGVVLMALGAEGEQHLYGEDTVALPEGSATVFQLVGLGESDQSGE
ncbi:MAG: hypothetical protein EP330_08505 [Deltaproteobacteria bacterium]|nr:MAG: hypothetical protein EP330_08505 [Deltaproteobacteria bacterium]